MINKKINFADYLSYSTNKDLKFYIPDDKTITNNYIIPDINSKQWYRYTDRYWSYVINKEIDFPDQGWKIHITADIYDAQSVLYDVSKYLISKNTSFKFVPNESSLLEKNSKYASREASGKFITIYPRDNDDFFKLLGILKDIVSFYSPGPYILNDCQWQKSNVFFRYGGLKRIERYINGEKKLVIKDPEGKYIEDKRVPYFYLPEFVKEPQFIKENNYFADDSEFIKIKNLNITKAIHFSNSGGVYLANKNNKTFVLKEGRKGAGIDPTGRDGFERIRIEYSNLKRLKDIEGVVKVGTYFTSWINNYLTEEYIEGQSLQEFIANSYPFNIDDVQRDKYSENCMKIIIQLRDILTSIHDLGITLGDLSLNNVMITDDFKVKLIDFEASKQITTEFKQNIATPGYYSSNINTAEESDWYAFHRIARKLFLPVTPVIDTGSSIYRIQNESIKKHFGKKVSVFLNELDEDLYTKTNIFPGSEYISEKMYNPKVKLNTNNINYYINGISTGLLNNFDNRTIYLTKGDIAQYIDTLGYYNIANGSFGVILSLIRSNVLLKEEIKEENSEWLKLTISYIKNIIYGTNLESDNNYPLGLFDGLAGIITTIYELGFKREAIELTKQLNIKNNINDISIYSGLSGLGLFYLAFYYNTKDKYYLDKVNKIARNIINKFYSAKFDIKKEQDMGFLTGWAGAALFLFKLSSLKNDNNILNIAIKILNESVKKLSSKNKNINNIYVIDNSRGIKRRVPYLENGSAGLGLVLIEFMKDKENILNDKFQDILRELYRTNDIFCSYNAGLFSGYTGLLPFANAYSICKNKSKQLNELLDNMNIYIMRDSLGDLFIPGNMGYKFSMDLASGSAGLLTILHDIETKNKWGSWLPILDSEMHLFEVKN